MTTTVILISYKEAHGYYDRLIRVLWQIEKGKKMDKNNLILKFIF